MMHRVCSSLLMPTVRMLPLMLWSMPLVTVVYVTGQQHADIRTKCTHMKRWCKKQNFSSGK